ncbi:MAG TPA: SPOR domain-containing protein [Gemmatimonadales bacterium]|nr:SPOR domain-containing protein [Gemmatimonadales bacterium]
MKRNTCVVVLLLAACSLSTSRPPFQPMPEARVGDLEVEVPQATERMAKALTDAGIPVERVWPQDGYFETPWFDTATGRPVGGRPLGADVVRVRGWVTPSAHGSSEIKVETVYRPIADPSRPPRELERSVPWSHPVRILVRNAYRAAGARITVEEPDAITLSARRAAARPAPAARDSVLPDSLQADSVPADSLPADSLAPAAPIVTADTARAPAPPQPPARQARDSARAAAARMTPRDTARTPAPAPISRDTAQEPARPAADTTRPVPAQPAPVRPVQPRPAAPAPRGFTVQVAATADSAVASLAARRLGAMGIEANVVTEDGMLKVRSGAYPTRQAAQTVLGRVRRSFPDAFVVR